MAFSNLVSLVSMVTGPPNCCPSGGRLYLIQLTAVLDRVRPVPEFTSVHLVSEVPPGHSALMKYAGMLNGVTGGAVKCTHGCTVKDNDPSGFFKFQKSYHPNALPLYNWLLLRIRIL